MWEEAPCWNPSLIYINKMRKQVFMVFKSILLDGSWLYWIGALWATGQPQILRLGSSACFWLQRKGDWAFAVWAPQLLKSLSENLKLLNDFSKPSFKKKSRKITCLSVSMFNKWSVFMFTWAGHLFTVVWAQKGCDIHGDGWENITVYSGWCYTVVL